ncbi:MAG TPA: demethoxyubiquinone hydroxylase family protein, partial [Rhodocyclaceae bacterium]
MQPDNTPKWPSGTGATAGVLAPESAARRLRGGARTAATLGPMDRLLGAADSALRTLFAKPHAGRPCPVVPADETRLADREARQSAALMRVNHVGEICAQALYTAQAFATRDAALRRHFERAA